MALLISLANEGKLHLARFARGAFLSLMSGAALHRRNLGVDRCSTCRRTGLLDSHGLERGLDVIDGRVAPICPGGCERGDEAPADPFVGPECVGRAVGVRLEPYFDQLTVLLRRRVHGIRSASAPAISARSGGMISRSVPVISLSLLDNK